tara:strand:- start:318 stop:923 length:606 start_codon:yes stop_codon:yes gene_type:complete
MTFSTLTFINYNKGQYFTPFFLKVPYFRFFERQRDIAVWLKNLIYILFLLIITSCNKITVFDKYSSVKAFWDKDRSIDYDFKITDTVNPQNLFIKLRTNKSYKFSNLFLKVTLQYPNGKIQKDTLEYRMARPDGSMLGQGGMFLKEHKLWYKGHKEQFIFSESGEYNLSIFHAMREQGNEDSLKNLEGVVDVGFSIETVEL